MAVACLTCLFHSMKSELQFRALRYLEKDPALSQRMLAAKLGVSLGRTNYCLRALVDKGWVKLQRLVSDPVRIRYVLTPEGIEERARMTRQFIKQKEAEYLALYQEIAELRAEAQNLHNCDERQKSQ